MEEDFAWAAQAQADSKQAGFGFEEEMQRKDGQPPASQWLCEAKTIQNRRWRWRRQTGLTAGIAAGMTAQAAFHASRPPLSGLAR